MPLKRFSLSSGFYDVRPGVLQRAGEGRLDVAVTTIRGDAHNARQILAQRLAAALMHIAHPNVERVLQTHYPGQPGFRIVTPRADGGTLRMYSAANPAADMVAIALIVAQAVRCLHAKTPRVIVGNLDLSSVLMHGSTPRIWDLTLCRLDPAPATGPLADLAPATGEREGMLTAMAPELYSTGLVTRASDVYAFGIFLFELVARHRPFPSSSRLYAASLLHEGHRPSRNEIPSGARGDVLWAIITRCWEQDPARRPDMVRVEADLRLISGSAE